MRTVKLCQIIAIDKGTRAETTSAITRLHRLSEKPGLFEGQERTFEPLADENQLPPESSRVQQRADDQITSFVESFSELLNVQFSKDSGNTQARANVIVEDVVVLENVPATFLLSLEKELDKVNTFFSDIPELDPAESWSRDENISLWRAEPRKTQKSKKIQKPVRLAEATKEHKEQVELVSEDVLVGFWKTTKLSGAFSTDQKRNVLRKVSLLRKAVKTAREEANSTKVDRFENVGSTIFDFLTK